ncbi:MAG: hypothetical protein COA78_30625 [Blastopirellula sp.]|nr:MAG: hypothetical protein COA78_30625 [Blastopirellula sp.]
MMDSSKYIIESGVGVGECCVGADLQTAIDLFGPTDTSDQSGYFEFKSAGVSILCDSSNKIDTLFLYYQSEEYSAFDGSTMLGIGSQSTIEDVLDCYGTPTTMSQFTKETSISYRTLGVTFTFDGDALEDVRVSEPRSDDWPKEWSRRIKTGASSWLAFAGGSWDNPASSNPSWFKTTEKTHATFLEFARMAELERFRILPVYEAISIKAFFEIQPGNPMFGEHIYLSDISTDGETITATLNATAKLRDDLKEGQEVTFPIEHLSDWFLVREGKGLGGFNIDNVLAEISEEDIQLASDAPPFSWYAHRNGKSAEEELIELPVCSSCDQRSLLVDPYSDGDVCWICQNGGRRCNCPKCNAPLIRYGKLPELCARCVG